MRRRDLYGGLDPMAIPAYSIGTAAHYLHLPVSTVRSWTVGRPYQTTKGERRFAPVIKVADPKGNVLSFQNLVEVHVLSSLRQERIDIPSIRKAVDYLRREFKTDHPLADRQLFTSGKSVLVECFGRLVDASQDGQVAIREIVEDYLKRIDRNLKGVPIRLFPYTTPSARSSSRAVSIDPRVQFGRPCVIGSSVPTDVLASRWRGGDSLDFLAEDYQLSRNLVEEAIRYEYPQTQAA